MKSRGSVTTAVAFLLTMAAGDALAKAHSRFVTAEMRAQALANAAKYPWAAQAQQDAIAAAAPWVRVGDGELWALVTSQELPRTTHTNNIVGCPNCGKGIVPHGNYPWRADFWNRPWKLECPNCGEVYPKNDFLAFYRTALDQHGMFRRELGDRSLLFNAEHPDRNDPLHTVCVDDGYGMVDANGKTHTMIAYYNHHIQWRTIRNSGLNALRSAYNVTGDALYAHKAAVLLDRIADVYPAMDYGAFPGNGPGRIENRIWETFVGNTFGYAYDQIFDGIRADDGLVAFCAGQAARHDLGDKGSIAAICRHIEEHLLLEVLNSVKDGRVHGNTGMPQKCLAVCAIALDRPGLTEAWLDWLFDPEFPGEAASRKDPIPWALVEGIDRDGMGRECGGYGYGWSRRFMDLPEIFAAYPEYTKHDLVRDYPKLKQCFLVAARVNVLDAVFPHIGDSGNTGGWGRIGSASTFLRGFQIYGDPRMAALAWHYAGTETEALHGGIHDKDPTALQQRLAAAAKSQPFRLRCQHLGRYGLAVLQTERQADGRALWIHYGHGKGHSHHDGLTIGLYAKNIDMLPDLGYPEYTGKWPKRLAWTAHALSHNTLLVNDRNAGRSRGGKINLFAVESPVRVMDVSAEQSYAGMDTYRRRVALIDVSAVDSYVFDVFRARGGSNHRLSYHGPSSTATMTGVKLTEQAQGTFAGEEVKFGEFYDCELGPGYYYLGSAFMYLDEVARSSGPVRAPYTVDWKAEDRRGRIAAGHEPHLRLHALTPCDEVALASGEPPQNKANNPRRLRYLIQSRLGETVQSRFLTVLEPYDRTPFIRRVRELEVRHDADPNAVAAVSVELTNGTTDIVIDCEVPMRVVVEGGIEFDGQFALVRMVAGEVRLMRMIRGRLLRVRGRSLTCAIPAYEGTVTRVDVSDPYNCRVFLEPALPRDAGLVGRTIHFLNAVPWDTSYDIAAMAENWISTGEITIISGFKDPEDVGSGWKYLVNPGDRYVVPVSAGLDR